MRRFFCCLLLACAGHAGARRLRCRRTDGRARQTPGRQGEICREEDHRAARQAAGLHRRNDLQRPRPPGKADVDAEGGNPGARRRGAEHRARQAETDRQSRQSAGGAGVHRQHTRDADRQPRGAGKELPFAPGGQFRQMDADPAAERTEDCRAGPAHHGQRRPGPGAQHRISAGGRRSFAVRPSSRSSPDDRGRAPFLPDLAAGHAGRRGDRLEQPLRRRHVLLPARPPGRRAAGAGQPDQDGRRFPPADARHRRRRCAPARRPVARPAAPAGRHARVRLGPERRSRQHRYRP